MAVESAGKFALKDMLASFSITALTCTMICLSRNSKLAIFFHIIRPINVQDIQWQEMKTPERKANSATACENEK